jgi:hypothetical protein
LLTIHHLSLAAFTDRKGKAGDLHSQGRGIMRAFEEMHDAVGLML